MAHEHGVSLGGKHRKRLLLALGLTASFMVVEAVVGFLTNSLVLIADAGHMLTDVAGLSLALAAIWFAQRPATQSKTYGYYRAEIRAALLNAMLLLAVAVYIGYEAYGRFQDPPDVVSVPLLVVAALGLLVNLISARVLMEGAKESLNLRGAFLEVLGDILGSVGAIVAGLVILTTSWRYADPLFAVLVAVLILPRTWGLLRSALNVLFEGVPESLDMAALQVRLLALPGVQSVHDLHVWSVTSGFVALSGHLTIADDTDRDVLLLEVRRMLHDQFEIDHVTVQFETAGVREQLDQPCLPGIGPCYAEVPELRAPEKAF